MFKFSKSKKDSTSDSTKKESSEKEEECVMCSVPQDIIDSLQEKESDSKK